MRYTGTTQQLGAHMRALATVEFDRMVSTHLSIKEERFHQGRYSALVTAAEMVESFQLDPEQPHLVVQVDP